ncbi:BamA/TamA family outer membrane protein [Vibrio astriarenae]|uniref:Translocation and assembly module subunit TamA n=1 Tax=Vibrio astriarenae TaxID=1481923 RepID=A0A7Z2T103_9VIBR|nr:autotransporter assembly complex family protein [Vibrio astriarenae]QIA62353.1 BamA/TamA family outer membrane protein [Vibrio astriarenae]
MTSSRVILSFSALLAFSLPSWAASLSINGLKGEELTNLEVYLSSISKDEYSTDLRFRARVESMATESLNALGYYNPIISSRVDEGKDELIVTIDQGNPVRIKELDIQLLGEANEDEDFKNIIRNSPLKLGVKLNHGQYDSLKSSIRNLALQKGYFDADYKVSRLEVAPSKNQAFIRLHFDSGIRYHFGATSINGSQIDEERVRSLQPFEESKPYQATQVGEFNQNLSNTDWFSSVFVEPELSYLGKGREIPMKVSLAPQSKNKIETGLGYSTDVGVRGSVKWSKPWVNSRGHSFDSSVSLSVPEQTVTAGYNIPLKDVLNDYYRLQFGMKILDNRDTESVETNLSVERHWLLDGGWHRTAYVRYLYERFTQGLQDDTSQFLLPGVTYTRTRVRGGAMPTWGDKQSITLEYGDPAVLSETRVVRLLAGTTFIRSAGKNHRGIFRLDGGANFPDEFESLPPSLRFFAGGDNSIRGYGYESVSPTDDSGALTGAKYIVTSSLEYQYRVTGNWWGAVFYDIGDAFNDTPEWHDGAGVGIRWVSPVGPIRFDFAWGLHESAKDDFRIHFSLGPDL